MSLPGRYNSTTITDGNIVVLDGGAVLVYCGTTSTAVDVTIAVSTATGDSQTVAMVAACVALQPPADDEEKPEPRESEEAIEYPLNASDYLYDPGGAPPPFRRHRPPRCRVRSLALLTA